MSSRTTRRDSRAWGAGLSTNEPVSVGTSSTTRRSSASRLSCMSRAKTTPSPTAAATGRNRVATNVAMTAICEAREVRMMARTCPVRSDPMAATISTAANVGIATVPTTPENASRMIAIQTPGEDRRPAVACAGRDVQGGLADRAADRLTPEEAGRAGCRRPGPGSPGSGPTGDAVGVRCRLADAGALDQHERRDRERPGDAASRRRARRGAGVPGIGRPRGISPTSLTRVDRVGARRPTTADASGSTSAISDEYAASLVRARATRITSADTPGPARRHVDAPGGRAAGPRPWPGRTSRRRPSPPGRGSCPRTMFTATPVRKPIITECGTNRV